MLIIRKQWNSTNNKKYRYSEHDTVTDTNVAMC